MKTSRLLVLIAAATLITVTGCARDPKPGTPDAAVLGDKYIRSMSDTLAHAQTFAFDTKEKVDFIAPNGEKRALTFTRKVTVRRPNALFFELDGTGDTALQIAAFYDGRTATLSQRPNGAWAQTAVPGTLDDMLDDVARRFDLPVPIGDVVYSSPYDAFLGKTTTGGFVGRETIDGLECVKLDYADPYVGLQLWLPASGPALPRRLEIVHKQSLTAPVSHIDFTSWKLDVPITDAIFAFQPPAGQAPVEFSDFVAGMASGIMPSGQEAASPAVQGAKSAGKSGAR